MVVMMVGVFFHCCKRYIIYIYVYIYILCVLECKVKHQPAISDKVKMWKVGETNPSG